MTFTTLADVGHRLLVETRAPRLLEDEKRILAELRPSSFVVRARNFDLKKPYDEWRETFAAYLRELRETVGHKNLMISIDHEGGRVVRPPLPVTRFPYAAQWNDKLVEVATAMAVELRSIGINVDWAPVADVLTNKESKAIGARSFGDDAKLVTEKALLMAKTLRANGITPAAKHFPGHGSVIEDSHVSLPQVSLSEEAWRRTDLPPFEALVKDGIECVMTAHLLFPTLDKEDQATISKKILVDILRKELGFEGVIVADALGMGAIRDDIGNAHTVVKALNAELDLFCLAGDTLTLEDGKKLALQILDALKRGLVTETQLEDSRTRITKLVSALPQHKVTALPAAIFEKHAALAHELDPTDQWSKWQYIPTGFD